MERTKEFGTREERVRLDNKKKKHIRFQLFRDLFKKGNKNDSVYDWATTTKVAVVIQDESESSNHYNHEIPAITPRSLPVEEMWTNELLNSTGSSRSRVDRYRRIQNLMESSDAWTSAEVLAILNNKQ